jgi:ferric-dicitrate binding protein FerR (iron transport regulator)
MNDDDIAKILRPLKDAPRIPAERREAAYARVKAAWQDASEPEPLAVEPVPDAVHRPGTSVGRRGLWALAASVVLGLAVGIGLWSTRGTAPAPILARVTAVQGDSALKVGDALTAGTRVVTGEAAVALALASGPSIRLAPASESVLESIERFRLDQGRVYVDSGAGGKAASASSWVVATRLGEVRHLGTQYLVAIGVEGLSVAVREGQVALRPASDAATQATAVAGERLHVARDAPAKVQRTALSPADAQWDWIQSLPTPFDVEGRSLGEFTAWYRRETGRAVTLEGVDPQTRLHGSIAGMTPDEALEAIAAATELDIRRVDAQVVVRGR